MGNCWVNKPCPVITCCGANSKPAFWGKPENNGGAEKGECSIKCISRKGAKSQSIENKRLAT